MTIIPFFKIFKMWCRFQKRNKEFRKSFFFSYNSIWIRSCKFSQSWTGYLASAVNLLTNNTLTSPNTKWDIFGINFPENDEKTTEKRSHGDFASTWEAFTFWLSKRVLKRCFLDCGLTKIFKVCNFGNTLAMRIIRFFKIFKIWCRFQKWNAKLSKTFSFLR